MYKTFLSLRYLRARRTNWIGMAGIFVAVGALILILSIMSGFLAESRRHLRGSLADLIIQPRLDLPLSDGQLLPKDPGPLLDVIRADPRVASACVQYQWLGILTAKGAGHIMGSARFKGLSMVTLIGIDPADEFRTSNLLEALENKPKVPIPPARTRIHDIDDPFATPPDYEPEGRPFESVILGEQLAWNWGLRRGHEVEIVTAPLDSETGELGESNNQSFVVAGTFRSGENEMDLGRVYFDRRQLSDLLGESEAYNTILVKLVDYERDNEALVADLREELQDKGLLHDSEMEELRTWEDHRRVWLAAVENEKSLMAIMLSLVMVVAGFTVFAILSMMVTEKRRDIGILCALGGTPRGILALFLFIGFWQAFLGALLGATAGIWAALKIDSIERWLSSTFGLEIFRRDVYYFDHIPSVVEPFGVALIVLGAFVCTLAFAAFPAWKAARLHPIDALRYE